MNNIKNSSIVFIHRVDRWNIGDMSCCPKDYFKFDIPVVTFDIMNDVNAIKKYLNEQDFSYVIVGGGGLFYWGNSELWGFLKDLKEKNKIKLIFWGVGLNTHLSYEAFKNLNKNQPVYPDFVNYADLIGGRDYNNIYRYLPCVSCMSPLFDKYKNTNTIHDIAIYQHKATNLNISNIPLLTNKEADLEQVLEFMSKAETIITNSFHGAYWSQLLNKKVLIVAPMGNRFAYFKYPIPFCQHSKDFKNFLHKTEKPPVDVLKENRELNIQFYKEVINFIKKY